MNYQVEVKGHKVQPRHEGDQQQQPLNSEEGEGMRGGMQEEGGEIGEMTLTSKSLKKDSLQRGAPYKQLYGHAHLLPSRLT